MRLLLYKGLNLTITEGVITAAAGNEYSGEDVIRLLLNWGLNLTTTEGVMTAAAKNKQGGKKIIKMLLAQADAVPC